jgi:hypothetical protein
MTAAPQQSLAEELVSLAARSDPQELAAALEEARPGLGKAQAATVAAEAAETDLIRVHQELNANAADVDKRLREERDLAVADLLEHPDTDVAPQAVARAEKLRLRKEFLLKAIEFLVTKKQTQAACETLRCRIAEAKAAYTFIECEALVEAAKMIELLRGAMEFDPTISATLHADSKITRYADLLQKIHLEEFRYADELRTKETQLGGIIK